MSRQKRSLPEEAPAPVEVRGTENSCEAALCSLLLRNAECRMSLKPEEAIKFLRNPVARNVASAIFYDSPENLLLLWTQLGETETLALIARGDEICARMKGLSLAEKWRSAYGALREKYISRRVRELVGKLKKSEATAEELTELRRLKCENHM